MGLLSIAFHPRRSSLGRKLVSNAIMANHEVIFTKIDFDFGLDHFVALTENGDELHFTNLAKLMVLSDDNREGVFQQ